MKERTIISLCDLTGVMVKPWVEAGYHAILVDPQHPGSPHNKKLGITHDGPITRISHVLDSSVVSGVLKRAIELCEVALVAGFPPCTDVAVSGARWFEKKRQEDPHFQAKAALVAEQCRTVGKLAGAPWFFENPVSVFSSIFGPPDETFDPYEYGGYLPEDDEHPLYPENIAPRDAYPKKTCLWTGGGFELPEKRPVATPEGYSDQFYKLGGRSLKTKNIRSATPRGFAQAVFEKYGRTNESK